MGFKMQSIPKLLGKLIIALFFVWLGNYMQCLNVQGATPGLTDFPDDGMSQNPSDWTGPLKTDFAEDYTTDIFTYYTNSMIYEATMYKNQIYLFVAGFGNYSGQRGFNNLSLDYALLSPNDQGSNLIGGDGIVAQADGEIRWSYPPMNTGSLRNFGDISHGSVKIVGFVHDYPNLEFEESFTPDDPTNPKLITQQLCIKNISQTQTQTYRIVHGSLFAPRPQYAYPFYGYSASIDVRSLGGNKGFYTPMPPKKGKLSSPTKGRYNILTKVPNGPDYTSISSMALQPPFKQASSPFFPSGINEAMNSTIANSSRGDLLHKGTDQMWYEAGDAAESATMRMVWKPTTLAPGQTAKYAFQLWPQPTGSIPALTQQITNKQTGSSESEYQAGADQAPVHFKLSFMNQGVDSSLPFDKFQDTLPSDLKLDLNSIKFTKNGGTDSQLVNKSSGNSILLSGTDSLSDDQTLTVEFDAHIKSSASKKTLTNTASIYNGTTLVKSSNESLKVADFKYGATMTQTGGFVSASGAVGAMSNSGLTWRPQDPNQKQAQLKFAYQIDPNGSDQLASKINFADPLPAGWTYKPSSLRAVVKKSSTDAGTALTKSGSLSNTASSNLTLQTANGQPFTSGQIIEVTFNVDLDPDKVTNIANTATISGQTTSGVPESTSTNPFVITRPQDTTYLKSVPQLLDFGSSLNAITHPLGSSSFTGTLLVNRYTSTKKGYRITVSLKNGLSLLGMPNKLLGSNSGSILGFRRLSSDPNYNAGQYFDVNPSGVLIKSDGFADTQVNVPFTADLTFYVSGKNQWQLRPENASPAGTYSGDMTWTLVNSLN
ncbi:hypothetical protein MOO45_07105 [Bombilactobacillus folatiphilus]|uniref:WxL domain-containing protein n=1 Tax=Bombilactobacillus folatiphilus TaxID=2923362 RepID=A0ABY4P8B4_9LACO|nr:hypothetical protein [Bombilactobacillus folatiphilus]UQS81948.1 hypothetical protein MOO45_07105 [Bombilactobacillus folatiphilus]